MLNDGNLYLRRPSDLAFTLSAFDCYFFPTCFLNLAVMSPGLLVLMSLIGVIKSQDYMPSNDASDNIGDSTKHSFELTQTFNLARQEQIQKICDFKNENISVEELNKEQLNHILVDHSHKLLYCYVPKVACTNWKRTLMILTNKWNDTNVLNIPATLAHSKGMFQSLADIPKNKRQAIVDEYNKFIFVRHPFERLLSAYRNKLESNSPSAQYFQTRVGKLIVKNFRKNPSNQSLTLGNDVTFEEFAKFLTKPTNETFEFLRNEHWKTMVKLCHPCTIKYTLIGKYETLLDDSILALHTINATNVTFPRDTRTSGTADKLKDYFLKLPLRLIKNLYKDYKSDFLLFNYGIEDILGYDLG